MTAHHKIDYIEIPAKDVAASKAFFQKLFGWTFEDYGPDYMSFSDGKLTGGFFSAETKMRVDKGSPLIVIYSDDLEATLSKVKDLGGGVSKDIFSFPGGRRFHFLDPSGNEFGVWSE